MPDLTALKAVEIFLPIAGSAFIVFDVAFIAHPTDLNGILANPLTILNGILAILSPSPRMLFPTPGSFPPKVFNAGPSLSFAALTKGPILSFADFNAGPSLSLAVLASCPSLSCVAFNAGPSLSLALAANSPAFPAPLETAPAILSLPTRLDPVRVFISVGDNPGAAFAIGTSDGTTISPA